MTYNLGWREYLLLYPSTPGINPWPLAPGLQQTLFIRIIKSIKCFHSRANSIHPNLKIPMCKHGLKSIKYILITKPIKRLIRKTIFLSLINLSLAYVYCSTTLSNHELIRFKRFASQINHKLCNQFRNQSIFNRPCTFEVTEILEVHRQA